MKSFLLKFRRITSSAEFIPQIDGLRFIAITSVFLHHFQGKFLKHFGELEGIYDTVGYRLMHHGDFGVPLFFVISGFILAMPFASYHLGFRDRKIRLRSYFLRRLTRLEPPYFIVIIGCFLFYVAVDSTMHFKEQLPHVLAALTYTHNFFYDELLPVNLVTWSLEIEVQFYILAPVLTMVFRFKPLVRRGGMIFIMLLFPFLNSQYVLPFRSLYTYLHYFMMGFLLVDFYLNKPQVRLPAWVSLPTGLLALFYIFYVDSRGGMYTVYTHLSLIFIFYFLALHDEAWKKVFGNIWLTTIGGMCYTIYLIHFPLQGFLIKSLLKFQIGNSYYLNFLLQFAIVAGVTLLVSGAFFYYIEKPCMRKNWYKNISLPFINSKNRRAA